MGLCHCKTKLMLISPLPAAAAAMFQNQRIFMQQRLIYLLRHVAEVAADAVGEQSVEAV